MDALLARLGVTRTANADALLQKTGVTKTSTLNSVLQKTVAINAGLSTLLQKLNIPVNASGNALLEKRGLLRTATLQGNLQKNIVALAALNAALQRNVLRTAQINGLALKQNLFLSASLDGVIIVLGDLTANARNLIKASGKTNVRAEPKQAFVTVQPDDIARVKSRQTLVKPIKWTFPKV